MNKFDQLVDAAREAGAKDPVWVANVGRFAVCLKNDDVVDVVEQIKRSQPKAFFSKKARR